MKYISFCSGIEAATVAWHPLGWEPLAFTEIEPFPSRVLAHHYPNVPNLGDFTAVDWSQWQGKADICVGGTPCQSFSFAGLRKSLQDKRGNLTLEFIRAINTIRPEFVVWENVPGVLSTRDNAFGCFLAGLVGNDDPILQKQGWPNAGVVDGPTRSAAWRILDAQYFGLAQRRRRLFVVACPRASRIHPAEILFEWEGLRRDTPPRRETEQSTARGVEFGVAGGRFTEVSPTIDSRISNGPIRQQLSPTVSVCLNAGRQGRIDAESETLIPTSDYRIRRLTPRECERLQGFPDDYTLIPKLRKSKKSKRFDPRITEFLQYAADGPRYKALGNSMAVTVMLWIGQRIKLVSTSPLPIPHAKKT
jgi:DNA (cytosine-5)-methyltransferase 1